MKKLVFTLLLTAIGAGAYAQGTIYLDNFLNTDQSIYATSNGLFFFSTGGLVNQDLNLAIYEGSTSNNLTLFSIFLLSNGTARNDNFLGPGYCGDPSFKVYTIQGATNSAYFKIQAWTGYADSIDTAFGDYTGQSPVFVNPLGTPDAPTDLVGMPAIVLTVIPEPSTLTLAGLGGLCVAVFLMTDKKGRVVEWNLSHSTTRPQ